MTMYKQAKAVLGEALMHLVDGELRPLPQDVKWTLDTVLDMTRREQPIIGKKSSNHLSKEEIRAMLEETIKPYINGYAVREYVEAIQQLWT